MEPDDVHAPDPAPDTATPDETQGQAAAGTTLDLDAIERDLADVEVALARLDAGTYRTDEITGAALPDDLLRAQPTARRLPSA